MQSLLQSVQQHRLACLLININFYQSGFLASRPLLSLSLLVSLSLFFKSSIFKSSRRGDLATAPPADMKLWCHPGTVLCNLTTWGNQGKAPGSRSVSLLHHRHHIPSHPYWAKRYSPFLFFFLSFTSHWSITVAVLPTFDLLFFALRLVAVLAMVLRVLLACTSCSLLRAPTIAITCRRHDGPAAILAGLTSKSPRAELRRKAALGSVGSAWLQCFGRHVFPLAVLG